MTLHPSLVTKAHTFYVLIFERKTTSYLQWSDDVRQCHGNVTCLLANNPTDDNSSLWVTRAIFNRSTDEICGVSSRPFLAAAGIECYTAQAEVGEHIRVKVHLVYGVHESLQELHVVEDHVVGAVMFILIEFMETKEAYVLESMKVVQIIEIKKYLKQVTFY